MNDNIFNANNWDTHGIRFKDLLQNLKGQVMWF